MVRVESPPAVFELWNPQPVMDSAGLSYGLGEDSETTPVWRLTLPADAGGAATQLAEREALLSSTQAALDEIPERLNRLLEASRLDQGGSISFDQTSLPSLPVPEADLLASLQDLNRPFGGFDYALGDEQRGQLEEVFRRFEAELEDLLRLITHLAWVETEIGDKNLIARTVVGYDGDAVTAWEAGLRVDTYQLHLRSVEQALASRTILVHALTITAQSAAKLAVLIATPGGALLALPLAWRFVNQILADVEKYKEIR